jgi:hypothetical protein
MSFRETETCSSGQQTKLLGKIDEKNVSQSQREIESAALFGPSRPSFQIMPKREKTLNADRVRGVEDNEVHEASIR